MSKERKMSNEFTALHKTLRDAVAKLREAVDLIPQIQPQPEKPLHVRVWEKCGHIVCQDVSGKWYDACNYMESECHSMEVPRLDLDVAKAVEALERYCGSEKSYRIIRIGGSSEPYSVRIARVGIRFDDVLGSGWNESLATCICLAICADKEGRK